VLEILLAMDGTEEIWASRTFSRLTLLPSLSLTDVGFLILFWSKRRKKIMVLEKYLFKGPN